ncbi:hypothetical protein DFJ77DRAFT_69622 [Powellomyces hirtus]|nr:hypothetical protein DFJ77DRAFT_69622 [Powellomyces hirtus]
MPFATDKLLHSSHLQPESAMFVKPVVANLMAAVHSPASVLPLMSSEGVATTQCSFVPRTPPRANASFFGEQPVPSRSKNINKEYTYGSCVFILDGRATNDFRTRPPVSSSAFLHGRASSTCVPKEHKTIDSSKATREGKLLNTIKTTSPPIPNDREGRTTDGAASLRRYREQLSSHLLATAHHASFGSREPTRDTSRDPVTLSECGYAGKSSRPSPLPNPSMERIEPTCAAMDITIPAQIQSTKCERVRQVKAEPLPHSLKNVAKTRDQIAVENVLRKAPYQKHMQELSARLRYALFKVQNGWERKTLPEVQRDFVKETDLATSFQHQQSPVSRPKRGRDSDAIDPTPEAKKRLGTRTRSRKMKEEQMDVEAPTTQDMVDSDMYTAAMVLQSFRQPNCTVSSPPSKRQKSAIQPQKQQKRATPRKKSHRWTPPVKEDVAAQPNGGRAGVTLPSPHPAEFCTRAGTSAHCPSSGSSNTQANYAAPWPSPCYEPIHNISSTV